MTESLLPLIDPDELIAKTKAEHKPVASVCLFSGGHDSTVLAHRCREHYDQLAFIDTGTALPGVRDFVETFARWIDKPVVILDSGTKFRDMVLGEGDQRRSCQPCEGTGLITLGSKGAPPPGRVCDSCGGSGRVAPLGFPGPAQHNRTYNQLKERRLRELRARLQEGHKRGARVLMMSGIRRAESARRRGRPEVSYHGSIVFCNPLIDWSGRMMLEYRTEHRLPESDVAALMHRSGECNCGSFAAPGEREMLRSMYPRWFEENIASLEREAEARGIPACRWGQRPEGGRPVAGGPLCSDCVQLEMDLP